MDIPPWSGADDPPYMPRIRRVFADRLGERMEKVRQTIHALRSHADATPAETAERLVGAVHDLSGTSASVGAAELGALAFGLAARAQAWRELPDSVSADEREAAITDLEALLDAAARFQGWMESAP